MKDGRVVSTISATLAPGAVVTTPRAVVHKIVTEFGVAELKGKSSWERAEALVAIAHPDFRDGLIREAEGLGVWRKRLF
jgi:acyl-CoA hydrolase